MKKKISMTEIVLFLVFIFIIFLFIVSLIGDGKKEDNRFCKSIGYTESLYIDNYKVCQRIINGTLETYYLKIIKI